MLTGKESKLELQQICDQNQIKYSKLDSKDVLIEKIIKSNTETVSLNVEIIKPIDKIEFTGLIIDDKLISGSQYCNINGCNKRTKFFIEKKYKEKYSSQEWEQIFKSEGLI